MLDEVFQVLVHSLSDRLSRHEDAGDAARSACLTEFCLSLYTTHNSVKTFCLGQPMTDDIERVEPTHQANCDIADGGDDTASAHEISSRFSAKRRARTGQGTPARSISHQHEDQNEMTNGRNGDGKHQRPDRHLQRCGLDEQD